MFVNMFLVRLFTIAAVLARSIFHVEAATEIGLERCLSNRKVPAAYPFDSDYLEYAPSFNVRSPWETAVAVTLPRTAQQIADSVTCAGKNGLNVQPMAGDTYGFFSDGGVEGLLAVNLHFLQDVTVDAETGIAKVGGGVRLNRLALEIYQQGKRALSHGTVSCFGIFQRPPLASHTSEANGKFWVSACFMFRAD